jgi:hypothetical protein
MLYGPDTDCHKTNHEKRNQAPNTPPEEKIGFTQMRKLLLIEKFAIPMEKQNKLIDCRE